ncbi:MAG TPA: DNA-binding response regulator [Bacteroidales bacterium]|nr:MAG: two-component system response regulator [Bacteroidetes bacterium GWF2_33_38]OFY70144.1 MAG: two-component system response regulator [Bacteroidetes bacterium RIFOXYA12_FULL_33_9]OFY88748.1 MAG: two-component system response regulator [Bacteroidetes bacterium RIFOXYA2_FULL_33_7]HBF87731.1 DNA-binding response regulator [Bacteroidales bacterium]
MSKIKILVAEDDPNMGLVLKEFLKAKGFEITLAVNGKEAYEKFCSDTFDFCILDVMMPIKDGFTVAQEIRKADKNVPIIFLTAKSMKEDTIKGLKVGADDYMTKPFNMEELILRINAILRRTSEVSEIKDKNNIQVGKYLFNYNQQFITKDDETQKLTSKETELLYILAINAFQTVERSAILKKIWGDDNYFNGRSMDVYIAKLRKYFREDETVEIMNIHGSGYKLIYNQ